MSEAALATWLARLETLHPRPIDLGLERVRSVAERAGWCPLPCPVLIVGGTNGKGSTVTYAESILRAAGYRTGATISPHLLSFTERIRIDGQDASAAQICEAFAHIEAVRGDCSLTYFEFGVLAAAYCFVQAQLDVIVLEVGLGGRLDATNLWDADVAVLTNVALDHADWLGSTREAIGREKVGIARPARPAVIADRAPPDTVIEGLQAMGASSQWIAHDFGWRDANEDTWQYFDGETSMTLPRPRMPGDWQLDNASAAITAVRRLPAPIHVSEHHIAEGIGSAFIAGRLESLWVEGVECCFDVGHNPAAAQAGVQTLQAQTSRHVIAVAAIMSDKDISGVLAHWCTCVDEWFVGDLASLPRALPSAALADAITEACTAAQRPAAQHQCASLQQAFSAALTQAQALSAYRAPLVLVFGSFYTVAAVRKAIIDANFSVAQ